MAFTILGPVHATVNGRSVHLGHAKQQCVLAALLWDVNHVLSVETLIQRVWNDSPPPSARNVVYSYVGRLRRIMETFCRPDAADEPAGVGLRTLSGGYRVDAVPEAVDLHHCRALIARARSSEAEPQHRARLLRKALTHWSGEPLAGIGGIWAETVRRTLRQERDAAMLDYHHHALEAGHHATLLADLEEFWSAEPLDEMRLRHLMTAFQRSGRPAEAVNRYERLRRLLADEMGIDPSQATQGLYLQILRGTRTIRVDARSALSPPTELPLDSDSFTGRAEELRELDGLLQAGDGTGAGPRPAVAAITGPPGIGKTALAVHWSHLVKRRFPDGHIYVDLQGCRKDVLPRTPQEVLGRCVRSLGTPPSDIPHDLDELASLYRSLLATRRVLVVLDDVATSEHAEHLLPGAVDSFVLLTSRNRLDTLVARHGLRPVQVAKLGLKEALDLLTLVAGEKTVAASFDQAYELCREAGCHPLVLRLLGARLAGSPTMLADLVSVLRSGTPAPTLAYRLNRIALADTLDPSCRSLLPAEFELLRDLFRLPDDHFTARSLAELTGKPLLGVLTRLCHLASLHLIEGDSDDGYRLPDLSRAYLAERADRVRHEGLNQPAVVGLDRQTSNPSR
ncbi:BTAD domain-containing putative transcriptional regulator [Streptomyces solisilvae]|uniref:AfsR/SARP family transcriptional regulator n=1 Tax=Streptomyces malaysiensis TaxID=92644 RepID=UPI0036879074